MMISALNRNWFKEVLQSKKITQRKLSELLNLDEGAFSRTLSGLRKLQLHEAKEVSKILDVPLIEVLAHFGAEGEYSNVVLVEWVVNEGSIMTKLAKPVELEHEYASLISGVYCQVRNGKMLDRAIAVFNPVSDIVIGRLSAIEVSDGTVVVGTLRHNYNPKFYDIVTNDEVIENQFIKNCYHVKALFPT